MPVVTSSVHALAPEQETAWHFLHETFGIAESDTLSVGSARVRSPLCRKREPLLTLCVQSASGAALSAARHTPWSRPSSDATSRFGIAFPNAQEGAFVTPLPAPPHAEPVDDAPLGTSARSLLVAALPVFLSSMRLSLCRHAEQSVRSRQTGTSAALATCARIHAAAANTLVAAGPADGY
jgi:hypothetical protein